jgi:3-methyladenine DNA glycosylase AlkC
MIVAEPFKLLLNQSNITRMAGSLRAAWSGFESKRFLAVALDDLDGLEFKARAMQIATALEATLPERFPQAADILESALGPPVPIDSTGEPQNIAGERGGEGLSGWPVWAMGEFVARRGLGHTSRALDCLHALTQRFSAEFAIRPFIDQQPAKVFPVLSRWTGDPSAHVRRLVSEGSRPRLPWGLRLKALVDDPSPTLPLLAALQDDPSSYVRRSVANHLNDIAKDHPDQVARWVVTHLPGAPPERVSLLRHASRHLIKQAHGATLSAWALDTGFAGTVQLVIAPRRLRIGALLAINVALKSASRRKQKLVIDYIVHHRKANGSLSPKVFKGWKVDLEPGAKLDLKKSHSFKVVTTRTLYPGAHRFSVQINGQILATRDFELQAAL